MISFGSPVDGRSVERAEDRSRYSSVHEPLRKRGYGEEERYGRSRTVEGRSTADRYVRSQSREQVLRGSGSVDRYHHSRSRLASSQYGEDPDAMYGRREERYVPRDPAFIDRPLKYRDVEPLPPRFEYRDEPRYVGSRHGFGRHEFGMDRYGRELPLYAGPGFDRFGYDFDREAYDRYMHGPGRYEKERYAFSDRYPADRSQHDGRYEHERISRDPSVRVRFDSERELRFEAKGDSISDGHEMTRRDSDRRDDAFDGERSIPSRRDGEEDYRTDGTSNSITRYESFQPERRAILSRKGSGKEDIPFDMVGGSEYRRGGQYGAQLGKDRMPPPIPPFSQPRSTYPHTLALTNGEDDRSTTRSRELAVRAAYDLMRRRYYERAGDPSQNPTWLQRGATGNAYNMSQISDDVIRVESVDFQAMENAEKHRTFDYELVKDIEAPTPVFRRGQTFIMNISFLDRQLDASRDNLYLNFYFGPNPSVPKRTRVVLSIALDTDFQRIPYQWDARVTKQDDTKLNIEVNIPASCPVGLWRCVIETSSHLAPPCRLQYRCPEELFVIFNPFEAEDPVYMENVEQRYEYVINNSGKVYTGSFRNVRGRPWIYGQFDDCVLPAACVLLEMSGLPHNERGNPVKVTRALSSMIRASNHGRKNNGLEYMASGLIEARFEEDFCGGHNPHLWTGSVQIIEEFLRRGATPIKYGQCWVMAALMTSLCRALGLPSRPVTAYVSSLDQRDSQTVDRYIDRFGDVFEFGPSRDQPDSVWSFHTWCDVYMHRSDQPVEYSGWQAADPSVLSGTCGPCPIEALRRGDIGQRDDVDAFYTVLNSYVRYFYEDDESGWGYSPFRQFRYPMSRYILTKSVGRFDDEGDEDCEDLTNIYLDAERTDAEKFAVFNSCRGIYRDNPAFEYQAAAFNSSDFNPNVSDQRIYDVSFELGAPERVMIGQSVTIPVVVTNTSPETRTIQTNICTRSSYYTGNLGPYLKRSTAQFILGPEQQDTVSLTLDPWDYEDKLLDMSFIKITVTGFVHESRQSFVDEFDFRFNKPWMKIEASDMKLGEEGEATFSFANPLEIPLTDCFFTMEVSGSVRPRTVRIDREVRPQETFKYTQGFIPRATGKRRMVACFTSRQLADVVGQIPVTIEDVQKVPEEIAEPGKEVHEPVEEIHNAQNENEGQDEEQK